MNSSKYSQDNETDAEVTDLINTANMEMLATLVLNGEGSRLIGRHSRNSELQGFLDNVATYMVYFIQIFLTSFRFINLTWAMCNNLKFFLAKNKHGPPSSSRGKYSSHASRFGQKEIRHCSRSHISKWINSYACGNSVWKNKRHEVFRI